jgi:hypothetical protein
MKQLSFEGDTKTYRLAEDGGSEDGNEDGGAHGDLFGCVY